MAQVWTRPGRRTMAAGAVQRMSVVLTASFAGRPLSLPSCPGKDRQPVHVHACWIVASYSASGPPVPDMDCPIVNLPRHRFKPEQPSSHPSAIQPPSHDGCHRCLDGPR